MTRKWMYGEMARLESREKTNVDDTALLDWFGHLMTFMCGAPNVALKLMKSDGVFTAKLGKHVANGETMTAALVELKAKVEGTYR